MILLRVGLFVNGFFWDDRNTTELFKTVTRLNLGLSLRYRLSVAAHHDSKIIYETYINI